MRLKNRARRNSAPGLMRAAWLGGRGCRWRNTCCTSKQAGKDFFRPLNIAGHPQSGFGVTGEQHQLLPPRQQDPGVFRPATLAEFTTSGILAATRSRGSARRAAPKCLCRCWRTVASRHDAARSLGTQRRADGTGRPPPLADGKLPGLAMTQFGAASPRISASRRTRADPRRHRAAGFRRLGFNHQRFHILQLKGQPHRLRRTDAFSTFSRSVPDRGNSGSGGAYRHRSPYRRRRRCRLHWPIAHCRAT